MAIAEPIPAAKSPEHLGKDRPLPSPAERPNADIVIYDGNCRICTAQIRKLAWWDCRGKLSYLSLHDPEASRRFPDLTHDMLMRQMYVVDQQGRRHGGAEAIRYLSRRLRRLWPAAPFLYFPGSLPVWQWLYNQVAKRRYQFGKLDQQCDGDACEIHSHHK